MDNSEGFKIRFLADQSVVVVEPQGPIRPGDFVALAEFIDPWIESRGRLQGLVVHMSKFPGWTGFEGFREHIGFLNRHRGKIERVAVAVGGAFPSALAGIAGSFIQTQIKVFDFQKFPEALHWAAGGVPLGTEDEAPYTPNIPGF